MSILSPLKFVQGAVAKNTFVPELSHFIIKDNFVYGYNGIIALGSPIECNIDCAPIAGPLVKAVSSCNDIISLSMTKAGKLKIASDKFKAFIECTDTQYLSSQKPEGELFDIDGKNLLKAIDKLLPFVGTNEYQPWSNGILLRNSSAYATNNTCLVEYWLGIQLPFTINIPIQGLKELKRIKEEPNKIQIDANSISFHFDNNRWLRTQLYETNWPDLNKVLEEDSKPTKIDQELFEALEALKPFLDDRGLVYFKDGNAQTHEIDSLGASYKSDSLPSRGIYKSDNLLALKNIADMIDFTKYPEPCLFYGENLRGAIIGQRQ